ncbi:MAG: ATP-dependent DNA helicase RecG [Bacteroidetes bacterium]|nr:ATP-dependent DNA helicase RecG [Bacteroidota bacterium]
MAREFLHTEIEYLKGVGPLKSEVLKKELGIFTFEDLLNHYPYRYIDRTKIYTISEINEDMPFVQLKGQISGIKEIGVGKNKRLTAVFKDYTGAIDLVWFQHIKWIIKTIEPEKTCIIFGKPALFNRTFNIVHPEIEWVEESKNASKMQPVYSVTEKLKSHHLDSKGISKLILTILSNPQFAVEETLPEYILNKNSLQPKKNAYTLIHNPSSNSDFIAGQQRFKYEEMFFLNIKIASLKLKRNRISKGFVFSKIDYFFNTFYNNYLPFTLTDSQKKVLKEIRADFATGKQMNRLLQGDVGSGKTIVALLSMLIAIDNHTQAVLMAPTEILAIQHFENISKMLSGIGLKIELLTGTTTKSRKEKIVHSIFDGQTDILIGTHALIEDDVVFKNLGLVIIDEQHRFGVAQRAKLWDKYATKPHVLVMTATPIPRTLAMTVYGDLDISKIDMLPAGRIAIKTVHRYENRREEIYDFLKSQISMGRQVYYVFPLIEESEKSDFQNLIDGFENLKTVFSNNKYKLGMVHGRMKAKEKETVMNFFKKGQLNLLVSTTVIEVGVDVPNATVMVIENTERFGLTQLHQLRGRVGRGKEQSYCILLTSQKLSNTARERIKAMTQTTDGFEIANLDLKLRGPGDLLGVRQSGLLDLKIADIVKDEELLTSTRNDVLAIMKNDPNLKNPENSPIRNWLETLRNIKGDWGRVS